MAANCLLLLEQALQRSYAPPSGRKVIMVARVTPELGVSAHEFPAKDPGAKVSGGRVLPIWINQPDLTEILTWNTGEASDLKSYGTLTHAERQFHDFMDGRHFESVEIELTHSPCTACADLLVGLLTRATSEGAMVSRAPNRREGRKVYVGSRVVQRRQIPAIIRWRTLYDTPPQATNWAALRDLHTAGWRLYAPRMALPSGTGPVPVTLL